jgi:hypothetical protein
MLKDCLGDDSIECAICEGQSVRVSGKLGVVTHGNIGDHYLHSWVVHLTLTRATLAPTYIQHQWVRAEKQKLLL